MMDNILVVFFMGLPFMVFLGLKYMTYKKHKQFEAAEEINSILLKHGKKKLFQEEEQEKSEENKAA